MSIPNTTIPNLQKVADVYDWFDPAIDHILREVLRATPGGGSRRSWEFAMIYLALHKHGALRPDSSGLGLGAGTERLIFALAEIAGHLTITDLYGMADGWKGVQTEDPQQHLMQAAPWKVDFDRIKAHAMDMREITYPDETFDFAWSTGSFEHIGGDEDFDRHLREVHRVLKPGGVYAFTTVVNFGDETDRIPHNYYFHPDHFADILNRSPLEPLPTFDCTVRLNRHNRPTPERSENYMFPAGSMIIHPIVGLRRGIINNANLAVLVKTENKTVKTAVTGFGETQNRLRKEAQQFVKRLWSRPQMLNVESRNGALVTQPEYFLAGDVEFTVGFTRSVESAEIEIVSRAVGFPVNPKLESKTKFAKPESGLQKYDRLKIDSTAIAQEFASIPVKTKSDRIYMARIKTSSIIDPADVIVRAQYH